MNDLNLPDGLTSRPLRHDDAHGVYVLMAAYETSVLGTPVVEESDILADWGRPSFDIAASTVGVFDGDRLLGYAEISGPGRGDACVDQNHLGRGIGTELARWMQRTARAQGHAEIGMPVPQGSPGESLLRTLGYRKRWDSWVLVLPEGREVPVQPLPDGYQLRYAGPEDLRPAYDVIEDAFLEWSVRDKQPFDDWIAGVTGRPGYAPWQLQVVLDDGGDVVGGVHATIDPDGATGFVSKVAVRADQRGKGLGRALLAAAFTSARDVGATRSELSTDSRTGALDLYLGIGMEVSSTWVNYGIAV